MSVPETRWPQWLFIAGRDERGGLALEPPAISRGRTRRFTLNLPTSDDYGDWTGGTLALTGKASPDAADPALVTYTVTQGTPSGGETPFECVLDEAEQGNLPAGNDEGIAEILLEFVFTPTGGDEDTIIATRQLVTGAI